MNPKQDITQSLLQIIKTFADEPVDIKLEIPQDTAHGDYSSNLALQLSKKLGKSPRDIAEQLLSEVNSQKLDVIGKVEVAGSGFLNFYVSKKYLSQNLENIISEKEAFGKSDILKGEKIMVEFTDPNPLKEFHIGHLYSNAVGESIARLFESQGAEVKRAIYQGDVGLHVAKAVWGINKKLQELGVSFNELEEKFSNFKNAKAPELNEEALRAQFLGETYALGATAYEESEAVKEEINTINKKVYSREDSSINNLYDKGKAWSLGYFETIYKRLGTKFDYYYFESEAGVRGVEIVHEHTPKIFKEDTGAIIFPKEISGLHTRVFINSLGLPTYEAKELGLAPKKYEDFPYDRSIIVTGNEIKEYFKVLLKALSLIRPDLASKTKHISHGMVRLPEGKMSSRTGNIITGMYLVNSAILEINKKMKNSEELEGVSEQMAVGAIKYSFLKVSVGSDLEFKLDESVSLEGNSGPYIQYTYARTQSILSKRHSERSEESQEILRFTQDDKLEHEELELLRKLQYFPELITFASDNLSTSTVCNYLYELSKEFNLFYEKHRITNIEDENVKNFRIALTAGVGQVIKNGLALLGISSPQKI